VGKIRYNQYVEDPYLLKTLFFFFILSLILPNTVTSQVKRLDEIHQHPLYELWSEKEEGLKEDYSILFDEIDLTITQNGTVTTMKSKKNGHQFLDVETADLSRGDIISFFLTLRERLFFVDLLTAQNNKRADFFRKEALYEYPHVNRNGEFFVYISDKKTGNRNPFFLNLNTYIEKEIVVPGTGEYFPVMLDNRIFFISGEEDHNTLYSYHINKEVLNQLYSGIIYCLRVENDHIYLIEEGNILKVDLEGNVIEEYPIGEQIQSFCIINSSIYYSALNGTRYVIKRYDTRSGKKEIPLEMKGNIVDVINIGQASLLFSSNKKSSYNLYTYNLKEKKTEMFHECDEDVFYPFYSENLNLIVFSTYKRDEEPKIEVLEYHQ